MGNDDLRSSTVRRFVSRAGGTTAVAKKLGVEPSCVIEWARDGISDDPGHAIALTNLGHYGIAGRGARPRCVVLRSGELDRLSLIMGGKREAARWLGVSVQTFRRYRSGKVNPTTEAADRIRQLLEETPVQEADPAAIMDVFRKLAGTVGGMRSAAKTLGISRAGLYRYANGERQVPFVLAMKLLDLLAILEPGRRSTKELAAELRIPSASLSQPEAELRDASVERSRL